MFGLSEQEIIEFFRQSAYSPWSVYITIISLMYASSFGLPLPEEVPLIGAGLVGHIAHNPHLYPPPTPDAVAVNLYVLASVCLFAVFSSDLLIFFLGRYMGNRFHSSARFKRITDGENYKRIQARIRRNGAWASGVFRFTPGLRFPGHLACGAFGIPFWKFCAIDGTAALLTVPTQILLVGFYGDTILRNMKMFKFFLLGALIIFIVVKVVGRFSRKSNPVGAG